jgi:phosphoribosylanthranilate isomerase
MKHREVRVKVCGVTDAENAAGVASLGVEYVGINFWSRSKRYIGEWRVAVDVADAIRNAGAARIVGLFVNAQIEEIASTAQAIGLGVVQLHGDETRGFVEEVRTKLPPNCHIWKALAVGRDFSPTTAGEWASVVDGLLFDTPSVDRGGSGQSFDWQQLVGIRQHCRGSIALAGGLTADTVADAIAVVGPDIVDVASAVEYRAGFKDLEKVRLFVEAVRTAKF